MIDIHANQRKWLLFEIFDERPLIGPLDPSGESEFEPKID